MKAPTKQSDLKDILKQLNIQLSEVKEELFDQLDAALNGSSFQLNSGIFYIHGKNVYEAFQITKGRYITFDPYPFEDPHVEKLEMSLADLDPVTLHRIAVAVAEGNYTVYGEEYEIKLNDIVTTEKLKSGEQYLAYVLRIENHAITIRLLGDLAGNETQWSGLDMVMNIRDLRKADGQVDKLPF
jgi:hypothetical protein